MGNVSQLFELRAELHALGRERWSKNDLLVGVMLVHACDERGAVTASATTLCKWTKMQRAAVSRAVARLVKSGDLVRVGGPTSYAYEFNIEQMRAGTPVSDAGDGTGGKVIPFKRPVSEQAFW